MNKTGKLEITDREKAEVLNKTLSSVFTATSLPKPLEWMDHKAGTGGAKSLPL